MKEKRAYLGFVCLLYSGLVLGSCGCSSVDPQAVEDAIVTELPDKPPDLVDELSTYQIASCQQGAGSAWLSWPATYKIAAKVSGGKIVLAEKFTPPWASVEDVVGSCWFVVNRDGAWKAYCFDYIRAGQATRGVPWYDPTNPVSWATVRPGEETYFVITGLYRDKRRNVSERTNIVRVQ